MATIIDNMRLFFAAPLDAPARARVADLVETLAATGADYKWTSSENLHLTLAFLGEMPEERLAGLEAALKAATRDKSALALAFDHIGAFESLKRPRVLWLGATAGAEPLAQIAGALASIREQEHPFAIHLTLGRQRSLKNLRKLQEVVAGLKDFRIESRIDRIELLRSRLSSKGPTYEVVARQGLLA